MNFALTSNLFRGFGHHRNDVPPLDLGRLLRDLLRDHRLRLLKEEVEVGRGNGRRVTVLDPVAEDEVARLVDVVVTGALESAALRNDVVTGMGLVVPVRLEDCDDLGRLLGGFLSHLFLR